MPLPIIPLGINSDGVIVGLSGAGYDGVVWENGVVTPIKYPNSAYSQAHGINNRGVIVGYYVENGQTKGFIAMPVKARTARALRQ